MNNLPKYYEKYFDEKFANVNSKIDDKFDELMDEIKLLRKMSKDNARAIKDNSKRISILEAFKDKSVMIAIFAWGTLTALATVGYDYIKSKFF